MPKITKQQALKFLENVPEQHTFYCCDGRRIWNMRGLLSELLNMSDDTFLYHSNQEKNDFSNWVRGVIGDKKLADDLAKAKDHLEAVNATTARVAFLESKI
jgi:predicted RNA-binding protein with PUA-like domain